MKKNYLIFSLALLLLSSMCYSQISIPKNLRQKKVGVTCGTPVPDDAWNKWFNDKVEEYKKNQANSKSNSTNFTIPVIVHIIHNGQSVGTYPNISQAQVNSQITVLNNDFAGTGYNVGQLALTGFSVIGAANCNITFCLAQKDPNGNILAEPGIDRINGISKGWTDLNTFTDDNAMINYINTTIKPGSIWNPTYFMNIWVGDASNAGLLGFGVFPAGTGLSGLPSSFGTATTDGVFCLADYFGTTGAVSAPDDKGRILTHEIGHWLGLRHIWGDAICGNDYCNDTPVQEQSSLFCPIYPNISNACPNGPYGDMFMNFMDYNDQDCMYMFTPDQNTRIQTTLQYGTFRNQLSASASTLCNLSPAAPVAAFSIKNIGCQDSLITTQNQSTGIPTSTYTWSSFPTTGVTFSPSVNAINPSLIFANQGTYTISLLASNSQGNSSKTSTIVINYCGTLGNKEFAFDASHFQIIPNPSGGIFQINYPYSGNQNFELNIRNCLGEIIYTKESINSKENLFEVDLSKHGAGIYFISIGNENGRAMKRLIISK